MSRTIHNYNTRCNDIKKLRNHVLAGLFVVWLTGCSYTYESEASDHYDGKKFYNPAKPMNKDFGEFLKWRLTADKGAWPCFRELEVYDKPPMRVEGDLLRVSFVEHATVLIQPQGLNILTDLIWSERASVVTWAGPRKVHPPGIDWTALPPIYMILISHNHYDHLDFPTLQRLRDKESIPKIIEPLGNKAILEKKGLRLRSTTGERGFR